MTDRTHLLSSPNEVEIENSAADSIVQSHLPRNYGSIQASSEENLEQTMDDSKTTIRFFEKVGFSLGHVYNDLCAGIWFSYTLLFMQGILSMSGPEAGLLLLIFQY